MNANDAVGAIAILLTAGLLIVVAYWAGRVDGDQKHSGEFKRGWIAGVDYEKQHRSRE